MMQNDVDSIRKTLSEKDTLIVYLLESADNKEITTLIWKADGNYFAMRFADTITFGKVRVSSGASFFTNINLRNTAIQKHEDRLLFKTPLLTASGCKISMIYTRNEAFIIEAGENCDYVLDLKKRNYREMYFEKSIKLMSAISFS